MRLKFQVNELDIIFKFLDRGDKGYIAYNDFCMLSEEKRRNLDRVDNQQALEFKKAAKKKKDWIQLYLEDTELVDLENMSKRFHKKHQPLSTEVTTEMQSMAGNLPQWIKTDPEFRFGMSTQQFSKDNQKIASVINNDYLKQYLSRSIAQKAMDQLANQKNNKKDWRNKVFNLRSQSVANQIKKAEAERNGHALKVSSLHLRPAKKATVGSLNRNNNIEATNNMKHMEFLNQPLTSLEVKNTHRTMNSTHGPFFKQQLPPLSAMNKYEKSTKASDYEHAVLNSGHKRAATKMDIRSVPPQERADDLGVKKEKLPHDPFYSQEMVKLADEAKEQLDALHANKI